MRALVFVLDLVVCTGVFSVSAMVVLRLRPGVRILTRRAAQLFARQRLWREVSATDIWLYALGFAWSSATEPAQAIAQGLDIRSAGLIGLIC